MKYLLFKEYESGFANTLMSLELAVGLAYCTRRRLVYYGSVGKYKDLKPIYGGHSHQVPPHRQNMINNQRIPTLVDLLEPLPIPYLTYDQFIDQIAGQKLSLYEIKPRLVDLGFVTVPVANPQMLKDFAEQRTLIQDSDTDILHVHHCTLGYYSRFFYLPEPGFYEVMEAIQPQAIYRHLAAKITEKLGHFNGVHIRLTDFRKFLPQTNRNYPQDILHNLQTFLPPDQLLVICTDESQSKDFFQPITDYYQNHLFLDEFIVHYFKSEFQSLPFTDEVTFGLICNLVMRHSSQFAGTPGSTFTGMIHRNWYRHKIRKNLEYKQLEFRYVDSGSPLQKKEFNRGIYQRHKPGYFSWNQMNVPMSTDAKCWYREWPESVCFEI